eukprot:UN25692
MDSSPETNTIAMMNTDLKPTRIYYSKTPSETPSPRHNHRRPLRSNSTSIHKRDPSLELKQDKRSLAATLLTPKSDNSLMSFSQNTKDNTAKNSNTDPGTRRRNTSVKSMSDLDRKHRLKRLTVKTDIIKNNRIQRKKTSKHKINKNSGSGSVNSEMGQKYKQTNHNNKPSQKHNSNESTRFKQDILNNNNILESPI